VVEYGFDLRGLTEIVCIVDSANAASLRVAEKLGLAYEKTYELNGQQIRFHRLTQVPRVLP